MRFAGLILLLCVGSGCASGPDVLRANPMEVPRIQYEVVWERTVDVVDDYFEIVEENRIDGRIETLPKVSATMLEPWHHDTVNAQERLEATLQTTRRRAIVKITPTQEGYLADVQVIKELEDLPHPQYASAGAATFRHDGPVDRRERVVSPEVTSEGWIALGRDFAMEQELLRRLEESIFR